MSEKPLLFLDVDGVLNCLGGSHPRYLTPRGLSVEVPTGTTDRLARLLDHFDPVWATAWLGTAHSEWKALLGLDSPFPWPYVRYTNLKLPEIIRHAAGRPYAWVDDDARWELHQLGWQTSHVAGLIVAPDSRVGLTDALVDQLVAFAQTALAEGVMG